MNIMVDKFSSSAISVAVIVGALYAIRKFTQKSSRKALSIQQKRGITVQRVKRLQIEQVLEWIDEQLTGKENIQDDLELYILPNAATIATFEGKLPLSKEEQNACYLIVIRNKRSHQLLAKKLVIAQEVSSEFSCLAQGQIHIIPIK